MKVAERLLLVSTVAKEMWYSIRNKIKFMCSNSRLRIDLVHSMHGGVGLADSYFLKMQNDKIIVDCLLQMEHLFFSIIEKSIVA